MGRGFYFFICVCSCRLRGKTSVSSVARQEKDHITCRFTPPSYVLVVLLIATKENQVHFRFASFPDLQESFKTCLEITSRDKNSFNFYGGIFMPPYLVLRKHFSTF